MKISVFIISSVLALTSCAAQNTLSATAPVTTSSQENISNSSGIIKEYNGKIGIGTATPDELLTVKGIIHSQEVLVDLQGAVAPDYVFEAYFNGASALKPSYQMMDLNDVSAYIKEHHHLPEIESAATLAKEGLELKKMNLLLLQKIEELTLYTIEQQSQIDQLKVAVSTLIKK
ncbi:hypothetical protein [Patiriisocius marinus]|uniref:Uncharacterized protein n=1 Tax=Patiriisocius marinus TaxID=1397112 RepID=A0A5J4IQA4_9FLAO|nr:hypothetical protein [Patiriisocius marinus]GER59929.1 hypothetical protein ULMA_20370 [Patiriisocius marinus]